MRFRGSRLRKRAERGAATVFVIGISVVLMACAGLVLDGGHALNERSTMVDNLEQAARAGAQVIDLEYLRLHDEVILDGPAAEAAAEAFMRNRGYGNVNATATADSVTVTASHHVDTSLLQLVGVGGFDFNGAATATAELPS